MRRLAPSATSPIPHSAVPLSNADNQQTLETLQARRAGQGALVGKGNSRAAFPLLSPTRALRTALADSPFGMFHRDIKARLPQVYQNAIPPLPSWAAGRISWRRPTSLNAPSPDDASGRS